MSIGWARYRWYPGGRCDSFTDHSIKLCRNGRDVTLEEFAVNLRESVADLVCFIGKLDCERCLELGDQMWYDLVAQCLDVAECHQDSHRFPG